jgi:chemotaxis regulatin CheY-phosphate phosphatase CheZ
MYIEQQLLSLVGAIEAYHRRTMDNFELPKEQHNKRLEEILRSVPEEYKGWLNEKLAYSNEKSLRKRLREIVKEFDPILKELIPDLDSFVDKVVKTRNYLTHNDEKLKDQAVAGKELLELVENLKIIAEICLLKELGFTLDKIKNLISRNRKTRKFIK